MKKSPSDSLLRAHSRGSFSRLVFESEPNNGFGHVNRPLLFRLFQVVVLFLRLITPCSYLFLIALPIFQWQPSQFGGFIPFTLLIAWCCLEALFFPYYCYLFQRLNCQDSNLQHFAVNKKTRMRLVKNCFEALRLAGPNPEVHVRTALKGWFLDVPLDKVKRGNLESWCAWAFFGEDIKNLKPDEIKDNIEIVNYIEKQAEWTFPEGYQDDLSSVRLDLDPIFATQRPFVFYATIFGMNVGAHIGLFLLGFRRRYDCSNDAQIIYYRKGTGRKTNKSSNNNSSSKNNNNVGPNNNNNNNNNNDNQPVYPLVFVHGIGIGYAHYLGFVAMLPPEIDVYLLEWPHVAMQMASSAPQIEESVNTVLKALDTDGHEKVCLSAHSLGNAFISWMLHHPIACRRVCSTVLIDPVTFLLCDPTVATTVVYNEPETTIDFLMHFFVARELFIANALSRHFSWSHNILFVEDLSAVDSKDVNAYSPNTSINESSNYNSTEDINSSNTSTTPSLIQLVASVFTGSTTPTKTNNNNNNNNNTNKNTSGKSYDLQSANLYALDSVPHLDMRHTIIMSLEDSIVPVPAVLRYLQAKASQGHSCFEVLTFKGIHGELFLRSTWVKLLSAKVRLHCGLPSLEQAVVDITDTTTTSSNTGDTAKQLEPLVEGMNSSGHNTRSSTSTSAVKNNKSKSS